MKKKFKILNLLLAVSLVLGSVFFAPTTAQKVEAAVTTNSVGYSNRSQTVYGGPGTFYATIGSIGLGEQVYIIEKEPDLQWYHIIYAFGSYGAQKSGYVPTDCLYNITGQVPTTNYYGGQYYANQDQSTWSTHAFELVSGSISKDEGVTLLYEFTNYNGYSTDYVAFIEYSTSSGPKRAYTLMDYLTQENNSNVALVLNNATLYYWRSTSSAVAGSVDAGEFVSVICKNGDWVYVEYNTNIGRKRGCFSVGNLKTYVPGYTYSDFYDYNYTVYPSTAESRIYIYMQVPAMSIHKLDM